MDEDEDDDDVLESDGLAKPAKFETADDWLLLLFVEAGPADPERDDDDDNAAAEKPRAPLGVRDPPLVVLS